MIFFPPCNEFELLSGSMNVYVQSNWFLWWHNSVFSYTAEGAPLVETLYSCVFLPRTATPALLVTTGSFPRLPFSDDVISKKRLRKLFPDKYLLKHWGFVASTLVSSRGKHYWCSFHFVLWFRSYAADLWSLLLMLITCPWSEPPLYQSFVYWLAQVLLLLKHIMVTEDKIVTDTDQWQCSRVSWSNQVKLFWHVGLKAADYGSVSLLLDRSR